MLGPMWKHQGWSVSRKIEGKAWAGPYCGFHGRGQGRAGQAGLGLASLNHFSRLRVEVLSLVTWDVALGVIRAEDYCLLD